MSVINPFKGLVETKKFPHARAHRTTLFGKIKDTFSVFNGQIIQETDEPDYFKKIHFGIFDYLTLGIHFIISALLIELVRSNIPLLFKIVGIILTALFSIPRLLFAGIMTLVCLPFIGMAHVFSMEKGNRAKDEILNYVCSDEIKLHYGPSQLPFKRDHLKNSLFFIEGNNQLFYIDSSGNYEKLILKDISKFRKEFDESNNSFAIRFGFLSPHLLVKRSSLEKHFSNPQKFLSTYYSLGEILKLKDVDLESIEHSDIEIDDDHNKIVELSLKDNNKNLLTKFTLDLAKPSDFTLFKNVRKLNIGGVQELIEVKSLQF